MPGAPAPKTLQDAMLLGAIAKGPLGSVFFKLVGPRDQVEGARAAFDAMIDSLRLSIDGLMRRATGALNGLTGG